MILLLLTVALIGCGENVEIAAVGVDVRWEGDPYYTRYPRGRCGEDCKFFIVLVTDPQGNALPNKRVDWEITGPGVLQQKTTVTNKQGKTAVLVENLIKGQSTWVRATAFGHKASVEIDQWGLVRKTKS